MWASPGTLGALVPPIRAETEAILTRSVNPSVHKKDGDADEGQGQEGSDRHPGQLGEVADRAPVSEAVRARPTRPQAEPGPRGSWLP